MTEKTLSRLAVLEEASALEAGGGQWTSRHVAAVVGLAIKTVLDTTWIRQIALPAGDGTYRWDPKTVRSRQQEEAKKMRRRVKVRG